MIIPRSEWRPVGGVGNRIAGPVNDVIIHHTAIPNLARGLSREEVATAIRNIDIFHTNSRKWVGIGYNHLADQDGRAWEGRGFGRAGAHTVNWNSRSLGIAALIDSNLSVPSEALWAALREIIQQGIKGGFITPDYRLWGHRDHSSTSCPGPRLYNGLERLRGLGRHDASPIGLAFTSGIHGRIVVTRYVSDNDWSFIPASDLPKLPGIRAGVRLSALERDDTLLDG
jgi:peptidoglycan recognition protein